VLTDALRARYSIVSLADDDAEPTEFEVRRNGMSTGEISRRIYHFSGYVILAGRVCEEAECPEY
jgi:hypothetical protein